MLDIIKELPVDINQLIRDHNIQSKTVLNILTKYTPLSLEYIHNDVAVLYYNYQYYYVVLDSYSLVELYTLLKDVDKKNIIAVSDYYIIVKEMICNAGSSYG